MIILSEISKGIRIPNYSEWEMAVESQNRIVRLIEDLTSIVIRWMVVTVTLILFGEI